ncbi:hypothetical protein L5515_003286 [Caenorhabditis briggsae]|uniref:PH domain-containing protein n=1 Tax=Caenorhabditis briggsae TaxID=6238 RepID=A0AAE9J9F1_CAEBR|nr:hypothetical protein L5515_003286 [Caenorhabditis briggsae]
MDNQFDSIMDRIRARQTEISGISGEKENEEQPVRVTKQEEQTPTKVFGLSSRSNEAQLQKTPEVSVEFRVSETAETIQNSQNTSKKASRFSMLAQEIENFEYDYESPYNRPKEAFMKGRSPRMSIGETRPAVLCTPAGHAASKSPNVAVSSKSAPEIAKNGPEIALGRSDFEARRIKFAQPMVNVNYLPNESSIFSGGSSVNDMSTVLGGSAEMMNVTTSSLSCGELSMNQHITHENTIINAQSCDNREAILKEKEHQIATSINISTDEYGAHTFMRKKVAPNAPSTAPTVATSSTSTTTTSSGAHPPLKPATSIFQRPADIMSLVSSPKPYSKDIGRSMFSPVHFTPKSTSSPKALASTLHTDAPPNLSPSKTAALQKSVAKTRRLEFEEKFRTNCTVTNDNAPIPIPRHVAPTTTIQNTPHYHVAPQQKRNLFGVQNPQTTVATVATAPIPVQTQWRGQANTPVVQGARADEKTAGSDLKGAGLGKLKNLKSRWEFSSATGTPIHPDATEDSLIATAMKMKETAIPTRIGHRSISSRKGPSASSIHSRNASEPFNEAPEAPEEYDDVFEGEDDDSGELEDVANAGDVQDTSRFIDHAFGFIEGTETPSPFRETPLAAREASLSPKKRMEEVIVEEEDSQEEYIEEEGSEEEPEEDVTEIQNTIHQEEEPVYRANNSQLVHSVSMYRRKQREKNATPAQPLSSISPSAPVASLTSPQKLRQMTGSSATPGKIFESENETIKRLTEAIVIEKKLVSQSERALARARHEPSFRGSREEFEAQRAYLVHMEKLRAMQNELQRVQREGARIIDGPRGTIIINGLTVSIDPAYVAAHIASKKSEEVFYFLAVLRYADQVDVSKLVTSDSGLNRQASIDFPLPLKLSKIPSDFRATLEIYGQRSVRESTTHEDKFKLKGTTLKAKNADDWCYYVDRSERETRLAAADAEQRRIRKLGLPCRLWRKLHTRNPFSSGGSTSSSGNQSLFGSATLSNQTMPTGYGGQSIITDFHLLGSFQFDISCPGKHRYQLDHVVHPLAGKVQMKVKKQADDGADILYRGFLSMYQRTNEGLGSWTRYWCVLENGEMKFWRQPEDEGSKGYLVLMDLSTCCRSEGASTVQDICPFPNSFHIDVWAPKDDRDEPRGNGNGIMQLRVMLAADTAQDLQKWLSVINTTSRQLCTWRNPIQL